MSRFAVLILLGLLVAVLTAASPPVFTLTLNPHVGYRPLNVEVRVQIEPNYLNTGWCLQWFQQGAEYPDGRHCEQLQGQYEARTHYFTIKALQTGDYEVSATLYHTHTVEMTSFQPVHVIDRF